MFHHCEFLGRESVEHHTLVTKILNRDPLAKRGNSIVKLVVHADANLAMLLNQLLQLRTAGFVNRPISGEALQLQTH